MIRNSVLFILFFIVSHFSRAQHFSTAQVIVRLHEKNTAPPGFLNFRNRSLLNNQQAVSFGFKVAMNASNMNFNKGYPPPSEAIEPSWKLGFSAGFLIEVPVYNRLFIQPEYLYTYLKGEHKSIGTSYTMTYFSLPVLLKYKLSDKFSAMAGPQFDLLIKAEQELNSAHSTITHDTEERGISATTGLEFNFTESLSLGTRYIHGLNHIGIGQRSAVTEFKYEMVQLIAAIRF